MKFTVVIFVIVLLNSCAGQSTGDSSKEVLSKDKENENKQDSVVVSYYNKNKGNDEESVSSGAVSNGRMKNGKLIPFYGENYTYFDKGSYLGGRAFVNDKVKDIMLASYGVLKSEIPNRHFYIMEMANKNGEKLAPHRTHQTGLSVDFMMPLIKNNEPYYGLDKIGTMHYLLAFNDNGEYGKDTSVKVDFNLIARHILILNNEAKKYKMKIAKVIIKIEYKDELFATEYGKKLKASGIYIVKGLSKMINALHDEHYHVDFKKI